MNLEKLFRTLSTFHPLSDDFKAVLTKEMVRLSLPKNHFLLEAPKISEHACFLETGFAIAYTFVQGRKQIERFYGPHQLVVSSKSFFEQIPSAEFIQLMEPGEVLYLRHAAVVDLLTRFPEANVIYRAVMNMSLEKSIERIHDMQQLSAIERFNKLLVSHPKIEQVVPQEYIASYLGITPQSLSRMKRTRGRR